MVLALLLPCQVVTVIKRLNNNKPQGSKISGQRCQNMRMSVHSALYLAFGVLSRLCPGFQMIPKKGDRALYSNYCTIALQSLAEKAYASMLSARLPE